jgi:hypothetical protein
MAHFNKRKSCERIQDLTNMNHSHTKSIPTGAQYGILHIKWDEEKSTYAGLAQENGFSPAYVLCFLRLANSTAEVCTCYRQV